MNTGVVINVGNDVLSASVASSMMILGHNYLHDRGIAKMEDIKKVIKGVHDARRYLEDREWVDKSVGVHIDTLNDALALLKEQEKPDCEHAEHDGIVCLGYAGCTQEDEPIEVCKECEKYTGNVFEAMKLNDKC